MVDSRIEFAGYPVYLLDYKKLTAEVNNHIRLNRRMTILSLNTLKIYQGERNDHLKRTFNKFTHIIPDGQSIVFALKLLKDLNISAISGAEFMMQLIRAANIYNYSLFFLGSPKQLLQKVALKLQQSYHGIQNVGFQDGYYHVNDEHKIVSKIADFKPNILFVAFGSPRKEKFIEKYANQLNCNVLMGVGGSYEVFVGEKQIDSFTKKLGLRWLIRALQDPIRLFPRYMQCNTYFLYVLLREIFRSKLSPMK